MQNLKKSFLIFLTVVILFSLFTTESYAQQPPLDVTVSPVFFDYTNKPGEVIKDKIRIRNNGSAALSLKIEANKLAADENGNLSLKQSTPSDNYISWLKFDKDKLNAPPREWTDLNFTINIPDEAAFGYYWAISITEDNKITSGNTVTLSAAAAVPILLNVKKEGAKAEAELVEFKPQSFINEYLPAEFITKIQNTGNVHIRPRGNIFISGQGNKDLAILEVNPQLGNILPSANRTFLTEWTDGFLVYQPEVEDGQVKVDKEGKPIKHLKVNWDKLTHFRFGPYTANLFLVFDNGKKDVTIEGSTSFWVIPWKLLGGIIVFIGLTILTIRFLLRAYVKKQLQKYR